jgi:hypothetical protein
MRPTWTRLLVACGVCLIVSQTTAFAAIVQICGFESGSSIETIQTGGTFDAAYTSVKRTGSYALRTAPTTTAAGWVELRAVGGASAATYYTRFYFRYATKAASSDEPIAAVMNASSVLKFELRLNSAGNLVAYDATPTVISTGASVLSSGTWYRIEVRVTEVGAGTDTWEVKINGTSELTGTNDLGASNVLATRFGKTTNRNGNTVDYVYDDIAMSDSAYPGPGQVSIMRPDGDGVATTWTIGAGAGSDWENVEEVPHDSDTTYLLSTLVSGDASTVTLESAAAAGISGTISAVKGLTMVKRDAASDGTYQVRLRAGGTNSDSSNATATSAYTAGQRLLTTDPSDSNPWTTADLDGLEVGIEQNETSDRTRVSAMYVMVDYEPGATATCNGQITLLGVGKCG